MAAPAGPWRLIAEDVRPGPMQMALDEVAAETAADGGPWTIRVYTWDPSTLSLGYRQDPETVDWQYCEHEGIDVVRRPTGGGGIYHDRHGDVSYSIVAPAEALPGDLMDTYTLLCEPLFDALAALGVEAGFAAEPAPPIYEPACYLRGIDPAHDVVAGEFRKISGNAQYRQREAVIQHGSLTHERYIGPHLGVFSAPLEAGPFHERVTSVHEQVGADRVETVEALVTAFESWADADRGAWREAELDRARDLVEAKFGTDAWNRRRVDSTA
jgi:lipoate-protein ligase A